MTCGWSGTGIGNPDRSRSAGKEPAVETPVASGEAIGFLALEEESRAAGRERHLFWKELLIRNKKAAGHLNLSEVL